MKVLNACLFPVIAFGWHVRYGAGEDVRIEPGKSAEISGPCTGTGKESRVIDPEKKVICTDDPDDEKNFVLRGYPLTIICGDYRVIIRDESDKRQSE